MTRQQTSDSPVLNRRMALGLLLGAAIIVGAGQLKRAEAQNATTVAHMQPDEAFALAQANEIILIDIRRPEEWLQTGVAEPAIGLDMTRRDFVEQLVAFRQAYPDKRLALICRTGNRTGHVTTLLAEQGFPGLIDVREGMVGGRFGPGWLKRGLPVYEGTVANVRGRTERALH